MAAELRARVGLMVGAHFVLACAISWGALLAFAPAPAGDGWAGALANPAALLVKFGPTLAGLVLLVLFRPRVAFVRRLTTFGGALGLAGAVAFAAVVSLAPGVAVALAHGLPIASLDASLIGAALSLIALRTLLGGGLGEEIGWRGFALPLLLQRLSPRTASLLLGVLWTAWHAPAFFRGDTPWFVLLIAQAVFTISLSFVFTLAWLRTRGSLPVVILLHGALNGFSAWVETSWLPALDDIDAYQIVRLAFVLAAGIAAAVALPRQAPNEPVR
jgi:membrane protease YdiL (CAAX protease family)